MGHAYKILLQVFSKGELKHVEVIHYVDESAAEEAFASLASVPQNSDLGYTVVKLYKPEQRYYRGKP